jgi:predicted histone-like DNA-binding protein
MINYSTFMWKNTLDKKGVEQAYAKNQVTKVVSFDEFVKHISDHNGVFTRGTVKGVVSDTCACLVEQLLNGCKVQFGELGTFSISITGEPAASLKAFSADNITAVNILFTPGPDFENLRSKAEFNLVTSRAVQAASLKAIKEGEDTIDLAALKKENATVPNEPNPETPVEPNEPTEPDNGEDDGDDDGGLAG